MMESLSAWLQEMMQLERINKAELARRLGVGSWLVGRWASGEDMPTTQNCAKLAEYYGISLHSVLAMAGHVTEEGEEVEGAIKRSQGTIVAKWLAHFGKLSVVAGTEFPTLGPVPAGIAEVVEERVNQYLGIPGGVVLEVSGSCLEDLGVQDGDKVLIDTAAKNPKPDQLIVARLEDGSVTMKRYQPQLNGEVRLEPANAKGPFKAITTRHLEIIGTVMWRLEAM